MFKKKGGGQGPRAERLPGGGALNERPNPHALARSSTDGHRVHRPHAHRCQRRCAGREIGRAHV